MKGFCVLSCGVEFSLHFRGSSCSFADSRSRKVATGLQHDINACRKPLALTEILCFGPLCPVGFIAVFPLISALALVFMVLARVTF